MHRLRGRSPVRSVQLAQEGERLLGERHRVVRLRVDSETHSRIWRPPASKGTPRPAATSSAQRAAGSFTVMRSPRVSIAKILPFVRRP